MNNRHRLMPDDTIAPASRPEATMTLRDRFAMGVQLTPTEISLIAFAYGPSGAVDADKVRERLRTEARIRWAKADALLATRDEVTK